MAPTLNLSVGASSSFLDAEKPNADAAAYYAGGDTYLRSRTYSSVRDVSMGCDVPSLFSIQSQLHGYNPKRPPVFQEDSHMRARRMSHDEKSVTTPRRFLIDVEETIRVVLEQEDTDGDFQISVTDAGPKLMALGTATSNGFKSFDVRVRF
jgi:alpha,alpha-trehalase